MKYVIYIVVFMFSILFIGCERDDDTDYPFLKDAKLVVLEGNNQSGYLGDVLQEEIKIKVSSDDATKRFLLSCEVLNDKGHIIPEYYYPINNMYQPDINGEFCFSWSLGCNDAEQQVKITLYTDSLKSDYGNNYIYHKVPSDEIIISASGVKPRGWAKACGCGEDSYYTSKIVSYDDKTLFLVGRGLLYSVDGGINWDIPKDIPHHEDVSDMAFNSKGWAYIITDNHGIFYSENMKEWTAINNGFLDYRMPTAFYVDDEILLASFYFDGLYISKDNGNFWRKLLIGSDPNQFIARHPNGDLYFWDKWTSCYTSTDLGVTWKRVNIDYQYVSSEIEDFKIDKQGKLYIGSGDATISIIDPVTYQGDVHKYYEWNASSQYINNITVTDDDVLYVVNGHPRSGIYSKKNNWQYLDVGFSHDIMNYYLSSDGIRILISQDGIYYFSK